MRSEYLTSLGNYELTRLCDFVGEDVAAQSALGAVEEWLQDRGSRRLRDLISVLDSIRRERAAALGGLSPKACARWERNVGEPFVIFENKRGRKIAVDFTTMAARSDPMRDEIAARRNGG